MTKTSTVVIVGALLSGCALKGDVRRVERQLVEFREETARSDSARAVALGRILDQLDGLQGEVMDSLEAQHRAVLALRGELRTDITNVQRQIVVVQELTGQSQRRLAELRQEIESRAAAPVRADPDQPDAGTGPVRPVSGPGAEELFQMGRELVTRGSPSTARQAFQRIVTEYPQHERAADAQLQIGHILQDQHPDSAEIMYERVVANFPASQASPLALYRIGLLYERAGDAETARFHFNRVVNRYPDSDEATLARAKLQQP